ncbi:MAG: Rpp14/Pop5 family protein [Candidatus Bathyarchaeota archaeon]|nr:Rpp14/Pop5 family protein [Candidatus Bathyarchaeota archaeon]
MKRIKRRYLALQLEVSVVPTEREFLDAVWGAVTRLFGECGASLAGLALISFDAEAKRAVLRVNLKVVDNVRAALATVTSLVGREAAVHVVAVSGTIKALRKKVQG